MRILIVDDEPRITRGIKKLITSMDRGHDIEVADNGESALKKVDDFSPDVIFIDIKMPLMDGLTFGKIVKEKNPDTVFVIVSGYAEFDYAQEALKIGVIDYVLKPIMPDKIQEVVLKCEKEVEKLVLDTEKASYYLEKKLADMIIEKSNEPISKVFNNINNFSFIYGKNINLNEDYNYKMLSDEKGNIKRQINNILNEDTIITFVKDSIYIIYYGEIEDKKSIETILDKLSCNYFDFYISDLSNKDANIKTLLDELNRKMEASLSTDETMSQEEIQGISKKIIRYIEDNYHKKISLNDIGNIVYMHSTHVSKVFKKETGINISDYIVNYRIKMAKELLCDPKYKVYDVAYKVGFKGPKYFVRVFKAKTGMTPSQFRKKNLGREL
ncbi:MAG: response regulator [Firmicutes bacterium]|nr:response regulator [Bacillota bacterium]